MNCQCCGSWVCCWAFRSRALWSTCLRLSSKEDERKMGLRLCVCVCVCWGCVCVCLGAWLFCGIFTAWCLLTSAEKVFCCGWVIHRFSISRVSLICYAQVTAKTAVWGISVHFWGVSSCLLYVSCMHICMSSAPHRTLLSAKPFKR